jgi:putative protease
MSVCTTAGVAFNRQPTSIFIASSGPQTPLIAFSLRVSPNGPSCDNGWMTEIRKQPELMSPAGYWPQLQTAIEAGADAVYFGLNHFSARAKVGFTLEELPEVIETLHCRDVKGFVTFNTLVFEHELAQAEKAIIAIAEAGTDAIIVQDIGIAQLAHKVAPGLSIHGSTQMSITSAQGVELAASLGCDRVVLGRELSLKDMRKIAGQTEGLDCELEVFVHGALCVSYSGQCFSSEAWGGRSANRGKCAQACRLSYDLIVDGQPRDLGPYRYLLSPGDLYALEQVPELVDIGIACLKIEGRYKDSDYVALTTRAYRTAIDMAMMGQPNVISKEERLDLEQIYSRGLGPYFMSGIDHQKVVTGRAPRHRGVRVGKVLEVASRSVVVETEHEISRGDGLVFDAADWRSPDEPEEGGNVYEVKPVKGESDSDRPRAQLEFGQGELDFSRIRAGDLVWRTKDAQLAKSLKPLTQAHKPVFTKPIFFVVETAVGSPLKITAKLVNGFESQFVSETPLAAAEKRALDADTLEEKLGRLGGTPYHLGGIERVGMDAVFVPTSVLNEARRQLVDDLWEQLSAAKPAVGEVTPQLESMTASFAAQYRTEEPIDNLTVRLHLLVRSAEQLDAAIAAAPQSITLDYLELYGLKPSVEKVKSAGINVRVASPRILKPAEQNVIRFLIGLDCEIVIRSGGLLFDLLKTDIDRSKLIGDFALNAANSLSVATYFEMGLSRITPTYDLNAQQISELTETIPPNRIEVIAFSHLPVFHTEHCVFCRFLSEGTDSSNCGHPCEKHKIAVRDSQGRAHPVMADVGCRNTVFGAEAQIDLAAIESWRNKGIRDFRFEFVHQSAEQIETISNAAKKFLDQQISRSEFQEVLDSQSQSTTQGSLYVPSDFKDLVQLS